MKVDINGVTLEMDIFEAEVAEKFQQETEKIIKITETVKGMTDIGKAIRTQCKAVFGFIDALFGKDKHKEIFGESVNLKTCFEVYKKINDAINKDKDDYLNNTLFITAEND